MSRRFVGLLLMLLAVAAAPGAYGASWTIPGTVNASGLNGTKFVSDVTLTNPGTAPARAVVSFLPSSGANPKTLSLAPGQTVVSRNVVSTLFGLSGVAGALSISSDQALLVRARTYNTAASGTYGVSLPVFADDRLLSPGDSGDALWISQDASGSSGYRTNIAVVFPDEDGGAATVTVYDADGNELGRKDFALDTPGLQQFSVGSFAGAVSVGRAQVAVTSGRAAGYAVVVDNVTGDSSLFAFEDLPGGRQDVLVNGVARANGRNAAFFRTDGRFYNPTDTDATVRVAFHTGGNSNPSPATATFVLPAGKIRDVVDVLDALLGLPVGSAGALRFESDWPVAILCRTSNVDPSGARPGTFGSQQKPVPLLSFVTSADAGAAITGIRQDASFRTNVGVAAGPDGASYTLTLLDTSGTTVATTATSLGSFGWTQPGIQDLFPTVTIPQDGTLRVAVTAGSLDVFDSSIDNLSGDPVVTPGAALPTSLPSVATIGPAGGSIRSNDGRLTLRVPAGALSQPVALSLQTTANDAPQGLGPGYQIGPPGVVFSKPPLVTLTYGRDDIEGSSPEALTLATLTPAGWFGIGGASVDTLRRTLTARHVASPPAAVSGRLAAAPGFATLAYLRSWEFVPRGRRTILVEGQMDIDVRFVGYSGPTGPDRLFGLGSNRSQIDVSYFVNGQRNGNIIDGTVLDAGSRGAVYTAGACPPPRNPVTISATIAHRGLLSIPYQPSGFVRVRILPRKWKLTVKASSAAACSPEEFKKPFEVSDALDWTLIADFRLDDQLEFDQSDFPHKILGPTLGTTGLCIAPGCGTVRSIARRGEPSVGMFVGRGGWNADKESMQFEFQIETSGPDKYDVTLDCAGYVTNTTYFGDVCSFSYRGALRIPVPKGLSPYSSAWKIAPEFFKKHDRYAERVTVDVHGTLESVCP